MTCAILRGKSDAGNPHVAPTPCFGDTGLFDEGEVASAKSRRGSLLYKACSLIVASVFTALFCAGCQTAPKTIRLMSFNVRMGCGHDDPIRLAKGSVGHLPQCADVIRRVTPDVVGIQEIDRGTDRAGGMDQTAELARLCGMAGTFVKKVDRPGGDYGLGMLSKDRPLSVGKVLMKGSLHTRALMICEFADYYVANTHFPLADWACTNAAAVVRTNLRDLAKRKPVFLMGDFNSLPDSETMRSIKEDFAVLSDETRFTWSAKKPDRTIDFVLVDRAHANSVRVLRRAAIAAPEATDHAALVVDVEMGDAGTEKPSESVSDGYVQ